MYFELYTPYPVRGSVDGPFGKVVFDFSQTNDGVYNIAVLDGDNWILGEDLVVGQIPLRVGKTIPHSSGVVFHYVITGYIPQTRRIDMNVWVSWLEKKNQRESRSGRVLDQYLKYLDDYLPMNNP